MGLNLSCTDNIDFEQANDFVITPTVNLDLSSFSLVQEDFIGVNTNEFITEVNDTTQLELFNEQFFRENVTQVDFVLEFENTFDTFFESQVIFLNSNNVEELSIMLDVAPGNDNDPTIASLVRTVAGEDLVALTGSDSFVIQLIPEELPNPLEGALSFQSRAVYFLEIDSE